MSMINNEGPLTGRDAVRKRLPAALELWGDTGRSSCTPWTLLSQFRENSYSHSLKNINHFILAWFRFSGFCWSHPLSSLSIWNFCGFLLFHTIQSSKETIQGCTAPPPAACFPVLGNEGAGQGILEALGELGPYSQSIFITHGFYFGGDREEEEMTLTYYGISSKCAWVFKIKN